jgi:hypothetical protein
METFNSKPVTWIILAVAIWVAYRIVVATRGPVF